MCEPAMWRQDTQFPADAIPGNISLADLSGTSQDELMTALSVSSFNMTHLVTLVSMYSTLPKSISSCIALERQIFPHLDLDHVPESIQAGGTMRG
jgi:GPI mannosyltransferase 4